MLTIFVNTYFYNFAINEGGNPQREETARQTI
jgi:hypothetical protein